MLPAPLVLIVDDDPDTRTFMSVLLEMQGYRAMTAINGLDALDVLRSSAPCLILLDLHMPKLDGWGFRQAQLADPAIASIPVICVTGHYDVREVTADLGIPCLRKPVHLDDVLGAVAEVCGEHVVQDRRMA